MRLLDLKVENFGVFSGDAIEFSAGGRSNDELAREADLAKDGSSRGDLSSSSSRGGFELVYGPNAAGKSTLLQLIRELLFGFARQNPYAFDWSSGEMAAEASIETADGRRIRFRRRKGQRATVVGEVETTGERIDEAELARILGGASQDLYQNVFGFSLTELSSGEKSLEQAGVSEALCGGSFGGLASFQRARETLLKRQQTLYKPTAKKLPINSLLAAIRKKTKEQREAAVKPRDYERLQATCHGLESEADQLRERLEELRGQSRHLERLEAALAPWRRLVATREELERLTVPDGFPIEGVEEFGRARSGLEELREEISQLDEDLGEKRARLEALELAPDVIEREAAIRALHQQVRQVQQFRSDIPLRLQESEAIDVEARARLAELSPDWTLDQLEELRTSLAQREAAQAMADERRELRQRQLSLEATRPELRRRVEVLRGRLEELAGVDEMVELRVLVERSTRYEVDRDRVEELEAEIGRLEHETELLRARVEAPLCRTESGSDAGADRVALESFPVPLAAAVHEFQERLGDVSSDTRAARKRLVEARAELAKRRDALGKLDAHGQVPDRATLVLRRRARDELWNRIRGRYLSSGTGSAGVSAGKLVSTELEVEGKPPAGSAGVSAGKLVSGSHGTMESPSPKGRELLDYDDRHGDLQSMSTRYEREVLEADALADERQAKAELVAQAEHLRNLVEEQGERVREADDLLARESVRAETLEREWTELWRPCGLEPLTPGAMLEWLGLYSGLMEKLTQLRSLKVRRRTLEERITEFAAELSAAMVPVSGSSASTSGGESPGGSTSGARVGARVSARVSARVDVLLEAARRRVEIAMESARERERTEAELPEDEERLAALDRELGETREQSEAWLLRWRSLLEELGFPASWEVDLVLKIVDGLALVREKVRDARSLDARVAAMREETARFESGVIEVAKQIAPDLHELPAEDVVLELVERLDAAKRAETERGTLSAEAEKVQRRLDAKRERSRSLEDRIDGLLRAAQVKSAEEFEAAARAASRAAGFAEETRALERELRMIRGSEAEADFLSELSQADGDAIASERERLCEEISAADEARQDVLRDAGIARKSVDDLEGGSAMTRLSLELESLRSELAASFDEWASLVLTTALIGRALKRFEREHQPAMLREVARLFEAMTRGEYIGVTRKLDERGSLLVEEKGGDLKEPGELSRGTREQLYLAIRLAYVKRYCEDSEPLPLVMDDVLVNFDDARARSTLEVLAEVSRSVQILFLTCHQSVVALVNEVLPEVKPIVLARGQGVEPAEEPALRREEAIKVPGASEEQEPSESEESWGPAPDIFDRRGRVEARSTPARRRRAKSEVPGKESSLRKRPGPLE